MPTRRRARATATRPDASVRPVRRLTPDKLLRPCDPAQFAFTTTSELDDLAGGIGQARALAAARFGVDMRHAGYNLYVMGRPGSGKRALIRQLLDQRVGAGPTPDDWCYVNNFDQPHKPRALRLPAGVGARLRDDVQELVSELQVTIPAVFESEDYSRRIGEIDEDYSRRQAEALGGLGEEAGKQGLALLRTPGGFSFAPAKGEGVMSPDEYAALPEEERTRLESHLEELQQKLEGVLRQIHQWRRERTERVRKLNEQVVLSTAGHLIDGLCAAYADHAAVTTWLREVERSIIESDEFRKSAGAAPALAALATAAGESNRYVVNVLVARGPSDAAPVVYEEHPTFQNLIGRVEHASQLGALVTNFMLIKPGALHLANGGYLLLDAVKLLSQPFSWEGLKRALSTRQVRIESLGQMYSPVSTVSLEPEPIPLDVKVVLFGNRLLYYLLSELDPEFSELFKVGADLEDEAPRTAENNLLYARLIGTVTRQERLRAFDRTGTARMIEYGSRRAEDAEKLSTHLVSLIDLMREADYWAGQDHRDVVTGADVERAIAAQVERADRLRDRSQEAILRDILHVDTAGARVGQVNALSAIQLGQFMFGQPSRVTANTRLGEGQLVDIQREVKLGGSIHSKGVLILSSFLASRYSPERPLSLSASLVFEQTYGQVEGDSASLAELCALVSSLAEVPIRQSLAVTGSVDQFGRVQAIGAVNEKIEGFFDICNRRGLTGEQGVLIPAANVAHLMLRRDVVEAAAAGRFHVYAVQSVDEALELLTGLPVGAPDAKGRLPARSVNGRVVRRLERLAALRRAYALPDGKGPAGDRDGDGA